MQARNVKKGGVAILSQEEIEDLQDAFSIFDKNETGMINISELKRTMDTLNFGQRNPIIYRLVVELESDKTKKQAGVSFEMFLEALNYKLGDFTSKDGLRRVFELFMDDPNADVITPEAMMNIRDCISETNINDEDIEDIVSRISLTEGSAGISFDDFYRYMTRKIIV